MADYRFPGEHMYHSVVLVKSVTVEAIEMVKSMPVFNGDVIVASYPKTGTTWMQEMTWLIQNHCDLETAKSLPLKDRMKFLEFKNTSYGGKSGVEAILGRSGPCIMKTHLPAWVLEKHIKEGKVKIILVVRNPKDTLVSMYHFYRMNDELGNFSGTWDEFFELYKTKHVLRGDFFDWYASWIPYLSRANVELFTYEDMKNKTSDVIDRVSIFIGKTTTDDMKEIILNHTNFKSMKANKMTNASLTLPELKDETSSFIRKGEVADWKNYFNQEQSDYVDAEYAKFLQGKGFDIVFE